MACVLDGTYTFVNSEYNDSSIPCVDYSNYRVTIGDNELTFIGTIDTDSGLAYSFATGGTLDDPIFPAISIVCGVKVIIIPANGQPLNGEATISICEKNEEDCPDVPFSESAPEKYADYFDENGNFVPKETSDGGGDCAFTLATLRVVDNNGEQPSGSTPTPLGSAPFIYQGMLAVSTTFPSMYEDYQVPLYNGSLLIVLDASHILSTSGDIEPSGGLYRIFGDATIAVEADNIT